MTHINIERTLQDLYQNVKNETVTREFITDENGVLFLAGSQKTTYVWVAFRISTTTQSDTSKQNSTDQTMTFRVIRLHPDRTESFGVSRQTGQMEKQSRFMGCRYLIGDVQIPALNTQSKFGHALRQIQEHFHVTVPQKPIDNGQINSTRALRNLYLNWIANDFTNQETD